MLEVTAGSQEYLDSDRYEHNLATGAALMCHIS